MTAPTVAPMPWTQCRWCATPLTSQWIAPWLLRVGFCSKQCIAERYAEEGRND